MIGFAIPFFKGHAFLKEAIESVRAQTSPAWRLWVSDEGVESGTQNLVESFQDSRISYHRNPRPLGMVGNWNRCLDLATTEQTTLLHSDDRLLPNYTEIMNRGFAQFPNATALFCQTQIIDGKSMPVFSFPDFYKKKLLPTSHQPLSLKSEVGLRLLLHGCFLFCPSACFHKAKLGERRFSPRWKMVQDLDLWTQLLLEGEEIVALPEKAYAYRRHAANSTVVYTQDQTRFLEEIRLYSEIREKCAQRHWEQAGRVARQKKIIWLNLAYCLVKDFLTWRWKDAWKKSVLLFQLSLARVPTQL